MHAWYLRLFVYNEYMFSVAGIQNAYLAPSNDEMTVSTKIYYAHVP